MEQDYTAWTSWWLGRFIRSFLNTTLELKVEGIAKHGLVW